MNTSQRICQQQKQICPSPHLCGAGCYFNESTDKTLTPPDLLVTMEPTWWECNKHRVMVALEVLVMVVSIVFVSGTIFGWWLI